MSSTSNLVLRTVYLSPELDNKLRASAYDKKRTKNDLIREYLEAAIKAEEKEIGGSLYTHRSPRHFELTLTAAPKKASVKKAAVAKKAKIATKTTSSRTPRQAAGLGWSSAKGNAPKQVAGFRVHAKKAASKKTAAKKVASSKKKT